MPRPHRPTISRELNMPEIITYATAINSALRLLIEQDDRVFMAGEDIGIYGGAFGVSEGLFAEFGETRIRDTPISEDAIVGLGVGAALSGLRPIVEIQFSDFVVNAMDAVVNQAAKLHFMYGGRATVPLVIRLAGGGGTGAAAQHSQSLEAWFAHVPGLKVIASSTPQDAHDLLIAAVLDPNPVMVFDHKLLYKTEGPVEVRTNLEEPPAKIGSAVVSGEGTDLTIVSYSMMATRALEAARRVGTDGISVEVIDLRSLRPLDIETVRRSVRKTGRLLITHEAPAAVGVGAEVAAGVVESDALDYLLTPVARVCGLPIPVPYAKNLEQAAIPQVEDIESAMRKLMQT